MSKRIFLTGDANRLLSKIKSGTVACTITSPPYGAAKDYGVRGQLGFGQDWFSEYLPSLRQVLKEIYRTTKTGGALWLVLDSVHGSNGMIQLPWIGAELASAVGWRLRDVVIWDKGKSLPWSHNGHFRNRCESILLFSKGKRLGRFDLDSVRDSETLSSYWVHYPERYHPAGKAPSDLWHFPIPMQGSWGRAASRHFCPFPPQLVARMVSLSTTPGDLVLDPFAGTGVVPAVAASMKRRAIGIEIDRRHAVVFPKTQLAIARELRVAGKSFDGALSLHEVIVRLRVLKYAKTLFSQLQHHAGRSLPNGKDIELFVIREARLASRRRNAQFKGGNGRRRPNSVYGQMTLDVIVAKKADRKRLQSLITDAVQKPPLSKFGLQVTVRLRSLATARRRSYSEGLTSPEWYSYRNGVFFKYATSRPRKNFGELLLLELERGRKRIPTIVAPIKVALSAPIGDD